MDFIDKKIQEYCNSLTTKTEDVLEEIERETYLKTIQPRMISGFFQGRFLSLISQMIKPKNILEIGTFTGYGTLCLCEGLLKEGEIDTIEKNEELEIFFSKYFKKSKHKNKIKYHLGCATKIIPALNKKFDLVFIDADKKNYDKYFELIDGKINIGGYIISDNMLWSGKVLKTISDKDTKGIKKLSNTINKSTNYQNILLPIRDGLMIAKKIK